MTYDNPIKKPFDGGAQTKAPPVPQTDLASSIVPEAIDAANDNAKAAKADTAAGKNTDPLTLLAPALGYSARDPLSWWLP